MRKLAIRSALLVALVFPLLVLNAAAEPAQSTKTVQGKVLSSKDTPISGAVVYLQDGKTNSIRSFISTADGSYHFGQLATDTDYQVWARYKNEKSATRGVSSYDSRSKVIINLTIKSK
ncbi:MAG: carboxypeptidase-like regulatory domain-containing protein [Acidobacteriaceae bacterium]